jgi:hypothetical protein
MFKPFLTCRKAGEQLNTHFRQHLLLGMDPDTLPLHAAGGNVYDDLPKDFTNEATSARHIIHITAIRPSSVHFQSAPADPNDDDEGWRTP